MSYEFDDLKRKTIAQQQAKMDTYDKLARAELPIPSELRVEVEGLRDGRGRPVR